MTQQARKDGRSHSFSPDTGKFESGIRPRSEETIRATANYILTRKGVDNEIKTEVIDPLIKFLQNDPPPNDEEIEAFIDEQINRAKKEREKEREILKCKKIIRALLDATDLLEETKLPENTKIAIEGYMEKYMASTATTLSTENVRAETARIIELTIMSIQDHEIASSERPDISPLSVRQIREGITSLPISEVSRRAGRYKPTSVETNVYERIKTTDSGERGSWRMGGLLLQNLRAWNNLDPEVQQRIVGTILVFMGQGTMPKLEEIIDRVLTAAAEVEKKLGIVIEVPLTEQGNADIRPPRRRTQTLAETPLALSAQEIIKQAKNRPK